METITYKKFRELLTEEQRLAKKKMENWKHPNLSLLLSIQDHPCIYTRYHRGWVRCPITGEDRRERFLPNTWRVWESYGVIELYHASDVPCTEINTKTVVRCYCRKKVVAKTECFYTEHVAGKCPHKERGDETH